MLIMMGTPHGSPPAPQSCAYEEAEKPRKVLLNINLTHP